MFSWQVACIFSNVNSFQDRSGWPCKPSLVERLPERKWGRGNGHLRSREEKQEIKKGGSGDRRPAMAVWLCRGEVGLLCQLVFISYKSAHGRPWVKDGSYISETISVFQNKCKAEKALSRCPWARHSDVNVKCHCVLCVCPCVTMKVDLHLMLSSLC